MIITGSCWPGCWTASTAPRPISPPSTTRSRRIWSLSRQRRHGWMRYPASERLPPRSSSPRSGWTCPAFPPPGTCVRGPSSHPDSTPPPAKPRATAPPATATATWPASSARPPWWPAEPIPSSVPGIGASPNGEVTNAPSSRSGARSYSSSGTYSPATTRGSQISEPTTSPNTSTRMPRNATTSANWKPSATPSPLPRPPEPPPKSTPDQRRPVTPRARTRRQVTIIFGLGLDDPSPDRPALHCNFGGALSALSVDTGFSCVADSDLSGQVRRFASDESAASSRQSVGCGCLLGPVATAVNRLYSNSASSMYQRVLVVVSNAISDREHVMRSPTPSLPATSGPTTFAAQTPEGSCLWLKRRSRWPPDRAALSTPCPAAPARALDDDSISVDQPPHLH